jgi:pyruvate dehydrogenase E2 component (dihydrolipoamide acetyltransferase)
MAKILDMPKLSPTMEEGVLATWHKKEGDSINVDDLLAEVETDKATMEFRAFDKGTILKLLVEAGASVKLGQPVAILGNPGEDIGDLLKQAGSSGGGAPATAPAAAAKKEAPEEEEEEAPGTPRSPPEAAGDGGGAAREDKRTTPTMRPQAPPPLVIEKGNILTRTERAPATQPAARASSGSSSSNGGDRPLASPHVRKMARERGIDLAGAQGSGEHGRILPTDLDSIGASTAKTSEGEVRGKMPLAVTAKGGAMTQPGLAQPESRPLSPMRKTIARRLTQAKQTVPHFYLTIDVDADDLVKLRESINKELAAEFEKTASKKSNGADAPKPEKISLNDLLIKGCAAALLRVPECNAQFTDEAILIHKRVDISVAVAIPDGLVTPVVRNADMKSVVAIAREVRDLAARARAKKLKPEEMSDGTFSISNLGMFGIDEFSAVINPPEGAILAVGQARDEAVVKDGEVKPGKKMAMTLSCDHRVVDGAVGAAFLAELRNLLEHPMRILTG